jgi:hypothetical protein
MLFKAYIAQAPNLIMRQLSSSGIYVLSISYLVQIHYQQRTYIGGRILCKEHWFSFFWFLWFLFLTFLSGSLQLILSYLDDEKIGDYLSIVSETHSCDLLYWILLLEVMSNFSNLEHKKRRFVLVAMINWKLETIPERKARFWRKFFYRNSS